MKKITLVTLSINFIIGLNAYGFDLIEDAFEFLFEDVAQIFGIIVMIFIAMYFIKRFLRKDSDSSKRFYNKDDEKRDGSVYNIKSDKDN